MGPPIGGQGELRVNVAPVRERHFVLLTKKLERRALVELRGTVDVSTATQLTQALSRLADSDVTELIIDLTQADLADSAALGALVLAQKQARRRHRDLLLAGVTDRTRHMLEVTGLAGTFSVVGVVDDA
jgi:anti-anti-sigma factor